MVKEEPCNVPEITELKPTRRRASLVAAEVMQDMIGSGTDCSDNDPDFDIDEHLLKAHCSFSFCLSESKGSSEDVEQDECLPQKKLVTKRKRGRPSEKTKRARIEKDTDNYSTPVAASFPDMPERLTHGNEASLTPGNGTFFTPGNEAILITENKATLIPRNESTVAPGSKATGPARQLSCDDKSSRARARTEMDTDNYSAPVAASFPDMPERLTPGNEANLTPGNEANLTPGNEAILTTENKATLIPRNESTLVPGSKVTEPARRLNCDDRSSRALASTPNVPEARAARGLRGNPKRTSPFAPVRMPSLTPPLVSYQAVYTEWSKGIDIIERLRAPRNERYYCCVEGCASSDKSNKDDLWLFAMPEDEQLMSAWDKRLPINYERNLPQSPCVCYRHFDRADFVQRQQRLIGLKRDALPIKAKRPDSPCVNKLPLGP